MRYHQLTEAKEPWTDFIVYGSFTDPSTGKNGFVVRMPSGRVQWSKKIVPAINRLVRSFHTPEQLQQDRERTRSYGRHRSEFRWDVTGDDSRPGDKPLWDVTSFARYQWDGTDLIKIEHDAN